MHVITPLDRRTSSSAYNHRCVGKGSGWRQHTGRSHQLVGPGYLPVNRCPGRKAGFHQAIRSVQQLSCVHSCCATGGQAGDRRRGAADGAMSVTMPIQTIILLLPVIVAKYLRKVPPSCGPSSVRRRAEPPQVHRDRRPVNWSPAQLSHNLASSRFTPKATTR